MFNLFNVTPSHEPHIGPRHSLKRNDKPRQPNAAEIKAYLQWVAERRGILVPADADYQPQGIYSAKAKGFVLEMPGYGQLLTVTMETLNDAGDVVASSTMPLEPKKGGVIWSKETVRAAAGPMPKVAKAKRAKVAPIPVQADPIPAAPAEPQERAEPVEALSEAVAAPKRGDCSPGPILKGEPWSEALAEAARIDGVAFECLNGEVTIIANERNSNYRTRIGKRWQPLAMEYFRAQARMVATGGSRWDKFTLSEAVAPEMKQEVAAQPAPTLEPVCQPQPLPHSPIATDDLATRIEALERQVAEIMATKSVTPTAEPSNVIPLPVDDKPKWQCEVDALINPTAEQEVAELRSKLDWWQHAADVRAELRFKAEAKLADAEKELRVLRHREAARPKRSAAHERAVRRAWSERKARRKADWHIRLGVQQLAETKAERDDAERRFQTELARAKSLWDDGKVSERKRRRSTSLARQRGREMAKLAGIAKRHAADLADLQRKLADPTCPERASDVAMLSKERDQARIALAAVEGRFAGMKAANERAAAEIEALASRVARAEAIMRKLAA